MKNKILLYGDVNLNIIDGSSIWLISLAKLLAQDKNNIVDILLKTDIKTPVLTNSLKNINNINFIEIDKYAKKYKFVDSTNIKPVVETLDNYRDYSVIIIRGFDVVNSMMESSLCKKVIPYITDFCHNEDKITDDEKEKIKKIYNSTKNMFVQTEEMKQYFCRILNVNGSKISILSPMVFFEKSTNVKLKKKSIVYVGKFAKDWNIIELIEIMGKIYKIDKEIKLYVIGNKFNKDLINQKDYILKKFNQLPNIEYIGALSREKTIEFIQNCELGYNFRSDKIDNDELLELSTKLLEYCKCGKPIIMRKTAMYQKLFGEDYPLYANSTDEVVNLIVDLFNNKKMYSDLQELVLEIGEKFNPSRIYDNIKDVIYSYGSKKLRLLITGHDLKFIDKLFPLFEKKYELIIQKPNDYMILNKKESRNILKKVDIIWCEWMLLNAEWYSKNKLPHQKLLIRVHRFEIERKYGYKLNMKNIDKIITVSYTYYEQFIEKFRFPRYKVTVVSNYVETKKLDKSKKTDTKYNIALIGSLPSKKGLDRAIDILLQLKNIDQKYKLFVAGKIPEQTPFWNLPEQRNYYQKVYEKIKKNNLEDSVIFTGWVEQSEFLQNISYTLSLTDYKDSESFHLAPMESIASGGLGLILRWEGCEYIYPEYMIFNSIKEIVLRIDELNNDNLQYNELVMSGKKFVVDNYDIKKIYNIIDNIIEIM